MAKLRLWVFGGTPKTTRETRVLPEQSMMLLGQESIRDLMPPNLFRQISPGMASCS